MTDATPDVLSEPPDEPVIRWMEHPPSSLGPATVTAALTGAFLLGVLAAVGAMTLLRMLARED